MKQKPPQFAQKFFSWYCRNQLHDSILGDLDERFYMHLQQHGLKKAKIKYWLEVFGFINRFTLRKDQKSVSSKSNSMIMLKNNITSSIRFLKRNKGFASINILGLTIGLTSFLLILLFINNELSFDKFHGNRENVYRINFAFSDNSGSETTLVNSPPAFAPGIQGQFPELAKVSRLRYAMNCLISNGERSFYESYGYYADSLFLEILKFDFESGNPKTALDDPNSIVITRELASKYFDNQDPIGSTLLFNNSIPLKVTGVISSIPSNSHLNFDYLISFPTYVIPEGYASDLESWNWLGFLTYVELRNGSDYLDFQGKLMQFFAELNPEDNTPLNPLVQNLSDIYLGSTEMTDDLASHIRSGNRFTIYSLMIIALLIVVIAGFNFANLTNAISINRGKAIGLRKVLGAEKGAIISQLITESLVIALCCLVLSYGLSIILFPKIASLLEWEVILGLTQVALTLPIMLVATLLLGLLAGCYPAILLSRINIIKSLKGELKTGKKTPFQLKNILVMLQFSISIGLISATFVLTQQIDYISNRPTGFVKENVVVIKLLPEDMTRYFQVYKEQLMQNSAILSVSSSDRIVGEPWPFSGIRSTNEGDEDWKMTYFNLVNYDYFKTMGINILEGRSFSEQYTGDAERAVIINQKAAAFLGLKDPVGKQVHFFDTEEGPRTIIGVVEDFNYTSMHQEIGPVAMVLPFIDLEYIYVRLAPGNLTQRIELMENTWHDVATGTPIEWRLLDDKLEHLYRSEEKLSSLITVFSTLAVFLACLGLYGIVAFMISNRIKEFGVRKVLGASVISLNILFVRQYIYQILIAMVIVAPLLHYYLNTWLQEFAYRINIGWWVYPLASLILLVIALFTITIQITKAAKANPVDVLRSE
jgi:putative ABC transport system permease protein